MPTRLEFTAANAELHAIHALDTRLVDWRKLPDDLGTFDLVVASDVLYEAPQAPLVAAALAHSLAVGGLGIVTDPGRRTAETWIERCAAAGLDARRVALVPSVDGGAELTVSVFEIRRDD